MEGVVSIKDIITAMIRYHLVLSWTESLLSVASWDHVVATLGSLLSVRESFSKYFFFYLFTIFLNTQLILPKWENVRISSNILWATINCLFWF